VEWGEPIANWIQGFLQDGLKEFEGVINDASRLTEATTSR